MKARAVPLFLVLLVACGQGGGGSAATTTATSAPVSNSTTTTGGARLTASSSVTFQGIGPVRVGMTPQEASAAAGFALVDEPAGGPGCSYVVPAAGTGFEDQLAFMVTKGTIARVDVLGGRFATTAGASIGTSETEVKAAYPKATTSPHAYSAGHYVTVAPPDGSALRLVFETDGKQVEQYRAGRLPEVEYPEGCS